MMMYVKYTYALFNRAKPLMDVNVQGETRMSRRNTRTCTEGGTEKGTEVGTGKEMLIKLVQTNSQGLYMHQYTCLTQQ